MDFVQRKVPRWQRGQLSAPVTYGCKTWGLCEMSASSRVVTAKIFLSWAHADRTLKDALLNDLMPALGLVGDVKIEWWQDSHLMCGEDLLPGIVAPLDEADYGLLLLSNSYFGSAFIRRHELHRFAGPGADKGSIPVLLRALPGLTEPWNLQGVENQTVFTLQGRSFEDLTGAKRTRFANELANGIRRRLVGGNGYRPLWQ